MTVIRCLSFSFYVTYGVIPEMTKVPYERAWLSCSYNGHGLAVGANAIKWHTRTQTGLILNRHFIRLVRAVSVIYSRSKHVD